jgi:hypothetical protein
MNNGKVPICHPVPENILRATIKGTGRWIASIHGKENFFTEARQ